METLFTPGGTWELLASSFIWASVGIIAYDVWLLSNSKEDFEFKSWVKSFLKSSLATFLGTLILIKLGDSVIEIMAALSSEVEKVVNVIKKQNLNPSQLALLIAIFLKHKLRELK